MTNSVQSLQTIDAQTKTEETVQPPPKQPITAQTSTSQDSVTISESAKQALANNVKLATGGADNGGDSR